MSGARMAFGSWKTKLDQSVTALEMDPQNARIPAGPKRLESRELIAELVEHDDVLEVAKSIAERGYYPTEVMIGVEEDGKKIILEGNRRLAALKCLISPDAAPEAYKAKFRKLAQGLDTNTISKVPVTFAPSRKAAAPLIANRHTVEQIQKWKPVQQGRYFRSLVDDGMTVTEVAAMVGFTHGQVAEFLRSYGMYRVACSIDELPDAVKAKVHDPRSWPASTVDRLLDNKNVRDFLGIEFDADGNVKGKIKPEEFKKGYARILSDVASEKVTSRTHNTAKEIEGYVGKIKPDDTPAKGKGSFTADDLLGKGTTTTAAAATPRKRPTTAKKSRSLVPPGFKCEVRSARIKEVFGELKSCRLDTFKNSAGVMLRVLFELSLGHYLDKSGKAAPLLARLNKRGDKPKGWYPSLRQLLAHALTDQEVKDALHPLNFKALNKAVSDDNHLFSIDSMDGIVHNRYGSPTESHLRGLWELVEDILSKVTLVEYKAPKPAPAPAVAGAKN